MLYLINKIFSYSVLPIKDGGYTKFGRVQRNTNTRGRSSRKKFEVNVGQYSDTLCNKNFSVVSSLILTLSIHYSHLQQNTLKIKTKYIHSCILPYTYVLNPTLFKE